MNLFIIFCYWSLSICRVYTDGISLIPDWVLNGKISFWHCQVLLYGVRDSRLTSWGSYLSTYPTAFLTPGQILVQSTGEYRILYKKILYKIKIYIKEIRMEMCFKFLNGSRTTIFLEYEVSYDCWKENLGVGLGLLAAESPARVHCKPESHMLKPQRTETGFLGSAPLPVTEHMCLARNPRRLASVKRLPSWTAQRLPVDQAVWRRHVCNQTDQI